MPGREDTDGRPLSVGQEALWFLHAVTPDTAAYNVVLALRIRTPLDQEVLARAVTATCTRYDALRSRYAEVDGSPRRLVGDPALVELAIRELPGADDAELHEAARECGSEPFDLTAGPPCRIALLRRAPDDVVLVLVTHHIATDAVSQVLLAQDLLAAYQALLAGRVEPDWAGSAEPFEEYVVAERALLESPRLIELESYWKEAFAGAPTVLELPGDRPRPPVQSYRGGSYELRFPDELLAGTRQAAAACGVTPFAFLLASYQALLHRYSGQQEFLVGCPTTARRTRALRSAVGYLVNSIAVRADFDQDTSFAGAAKSAYGQVAKGLAHQDYPFARLATALELPRDPSRTPVFQAAFTMVAAGGNDPLLDLLAEGEPAHGQGRELEFAGLRLSAFDVAQQEGQFDLAVELVRSSRSLKAVFRYSGDLFDEATVARFARHYLRLVEAAVEDPGARPAEVPLVDADEQLHLLQLGAGAVW